MMVDDCHESGEMPHSSRSFQTEAKITLLGFDTEEKARALGAQISALVQVLSRDLDLMALDGITVACDYHSALANLDRGVEGLRPLSPSSDHSLGVAMTPAVLRDGTIKAHVVLSAGVVQPLLDETDPLYGEAIYTVAHELSHVDETGHFERAVPGLTLRARFENFYGAILFPIAEACWKEYYACRLSARFGPEQIAHFEEVFLGCLSAVEKDIVSAFDTFQTDGDEQSITYRVAHLKGALLKYASYMLGHLHGLDALLDELAPEAANAINGSYFHQDFDELEAALSNMWSTRNNWRGIEAFNPLGEVADHALARSGLVLSWQENRFPNVEVLPS